MSGGEGNRVRQHIYRVLYVQVVAAILVGVALGAAAPAWGVAMKPLGDGFIKLIRMLIAPVIFCTVVAGIAAMQDARRVGRVGGKAIVYFEVVSTVALLIGIAVALVVRPGAGFNVDPASLDAGSVATYAAQAKSQSVVDFLLNIIPTSPVDAFAKGDVLQVLLFALLFGFALAALGERAAAVRGVIDQTGAVIFRIIHIVMRLAPLGAFGAMAFTIGRYGFGALIPLGKLMAAFYLTALLFVLVVLGSICRLLGFSILRFLAYLKEELLLVLGTSSSESALPTLMQKLEALGCPRAIVGLVVPTGYSFNLDGTNIYMTMAALFIAQATNTDLSAAQIATLLAVAMLTSKGASGVTGAGFVTLAATIAVVPDIPLAGMALILGVDRFMSECRALTNIVGNSVATVFVSWWERDLDQAMLRARLGEPVQPHAV
jgi:aerobic C4-dicarboxylate transport protein